MEENNKMITLDEFVNISIEDIERFRSNWMKGVKDHPDHYPTILPLGEWFEQLMFELTSGCIGEVDE